MSNTAFLSWLSHRRQFNETVRHTIISHQEDTLPSSHRSPRPRVRIRWMLPIAAFVAIAVLSIPSGALAQDGTEAVYDYDFGSDAEGWTVGFADLPVGHDQSIFELDHGHRTLPDGLEGSGVYVQGPSPHRRRPLPASHVCRPFFVAYFQWDIEAISVYAL